MSPVLFVQQTGHGKVTDWSRIPLLLPRPNKPQTWAWGEEGWEVDTEEGCGQDCVLIQSCLHPSLFWFPWSDAGNPPSFKFGESGSRAILCPISGGSTRKVASLGQKWPSDAVLEVICKSRNGGVAVWARGDRREPMSHCLMSFLSAVRKDLNLRMGKNHSSQKKI